MFESVKKRTSTILNFADLIPGPLLDRVGLDRRAKYLFEHVREAIDGIEADPTVATRAEAIRRLRTLGMDDFAYLLWSMPNVNYPKLSGLLPAMADASVQRHWTGRSGVALLKPTVNFVRVMLYNYAALTGRRLSSSADVLDYGCGYGRIARVMYHVCDEDHVTGVDPWRQSIDLCRRAGLSTNFVESTYLPERLPVGDKKFDLVYAYSVFTHLSEAAALAALGALRKSISQDGVLVITTRPIEYWRFARYITPSTALDLEKAHRQRGFSFFPHTKGHEHNSLDGDATYGDTSITSDWFRTNCPQWELSLIDRTLDDRLQNYLFLRPV